MSQKAVSAFFDQKASETYDERNSKLSSIIKNYIFTCVAFHPIL